MRSRRERPAPGATVRRWAPIASRVLLIATLALGVAWALTGRTTWRSRAPLQDHVFGPTSDPELGQDVVFVRGPNDSSVRNATPSSAIETAQKLGVDREALQRVMDRTSGLPQEAYFNLLKVVSGTPIETLKQTAQGEDKITYLNLWTHAAEHRGAVVALTGHIRGAVEFQVSDDPGVNPSPYRTLYQCDMFTTAAHPMPYILVVPELPAGMPRGRNIVEDVSFVGFFLKQWRYTSSGLTQRSAPLLIGKIVAWKPAPNAAKMSEARRSTTILTAIGAALAVGAAWVIARRAPPSPQPAPAAADELRGLAALEQAVGSTSTDAIGPRETIGDETRKPAPEKNEATAV